MATGGIKIPSSGETTPEYNAVRKSRGEIEPAIIPDDFVSRAHSCGLIPTRNPSRPPLDMVLDEISLNPVNYYSLQHVVATALNVGNRFDKGVNKMEKIFQLEMRKYIPAGSSEDPKIEPNNCPKVFISFSRRKVYGDSPDAYTEAKGLYDELEAKGCRPWMDEKGLEFGDVLAKEIFQAIKQCDFIIPIMTGGYATSLWCLRELYYAALQKDPKPKTIIPMLLEDEAVIDDQKAGKWLLRIGTGQKYFKKEEKADMIKSLKDKQPQRPNTDQSQPILKRSAGEAGMDLPASGFKIPKLLQDSSALNRPMDPGEHPLPTEESKTDKGDGGIPPRFSPGDPVPTPANNGNASLPLTEATMYIPLCTTADLDEEDIRSGTVEPVEAMETDEGHAYGDVLSAWVPKNALWGKKELAVKFLNNIPAQWTYGGSGMNVGNIMSWANEWSLRGGGTIIPKFTRVDQPSAPSDIRIKFINDGKTRSIIGKKATKAKYDQPTMWLDLGVSGDDYKKHLVIHEFGHALGLGHEHQRSDFWKHIRPYIDIAKMKKDLGLTNYPEAFRKNWDSDSQFKTDKCTAYDPCSIMHFWFKKQWLKNGYSDQSKVERDHDSGVLPKNVAEALLGVHLRSSIPLADKPSDMDIQLLKDLYGNTSCTILGPPLQPETLQNLRKVNRVVSDDGDITPPMQRPSQEGKLTLRLLSSLKLQSGGKVNIIDQVAPKWRDFATNLDFDPIGNTMQIIDQRNRGDPNACCRDMMQMWLRGMGRQPATLKLLVDILEDCKLIVLAEQVNGAIPYN